YKALSSPGHRPFSTRSLPTGLPGPSTLSIHDIRPPKPSSFTGQRDHVKVSNWLAEVEQYVNFYNLDKDNGEAVQTAAMWISGDAGIWWRSLYEDGSTPKDWDLFVQMVRAHWIPTNSEENIRERLYHLTQKTSVAGYAAEFRRLLLLHPRLSQKDQLFQFKQ